MKKTAQIVVGGLVALMVAWLAGWLMGRSGRPELQTALDKTQVQLMLAEARSSLLEARVDLFTVNFGNASRRFEEAKVSLRQVSERLADEGPEAAATQIGIALKQVDEGQMLANKLDQTANARADEAVAAINQALKAVRE